MIDEKRMHIKLKTSLFLFLIGGFVGAVIDIIGRFFIDGFPLYRNYLGTISNFIIPFYPVYGFGLIAVYLLTPLAKKINFLLKLLLFAISLTTIEFFAGVFVKLTLGIQLWDYSKSTFHLFGYIDLLHTVMWMILGTTTFYLLQKFPPKKWLFLPKKWLNKLVN